MSNEWYIDVGIRNTIEIKFTFFNLEKGYDFLKV